jgi:hypothetical protein
MDGPEPGVSGNIFSGTMEPLFTSSGRGCKDEAALKTRNELIGQAKRVYGS